LLIKDFINSIEPILIPNRTKYLDALRDSYNVIRKDKNIDNELKERVHLMLSGKGVDLHY
jgi:hypothetical protein